MALMTTILKTPRQSCESPFILSCRAMIGGDPTELQFIGDYARARQVEIKSLRTGDVASVGGKVRDHGTTVLVETFTMHNEMKGRNKRCYA